MMIDFMGDNVFLGKIVICVKFVFYVIIEGEIDINCVICWVIEWFYYGLVCFVVGMCYFMVYD